MLQNDINWQIEFSSLNEIDCNYVQALHNENHEKNMCI